MQKGQALLIIILTMVVALTVGLSAVSRSITTLRISTAEEESQRAFSAAEAGIEEALKSGGNIALTTLPNNAQYSANVTSTGNTTELLTNGGQDVQKDNAVQVWLSSYPNYTSPYSGTITVYWGDPGDACDNVAALEVITLSGVATSPTLSRFALDPCSVSRANNFTNVTGGAGSIQGISFRNSYSISVASALIMRIIPLYKSTKIAVKGSAVLPAQGKEIESTGTIVSGGENIKRKIKVFQYYPSLPGTNFDYAIFSGTNL